MIDSVVYSGEEWLIVINDVEKNVYKWDYTFHKWGDKELQLVKGHNCSTRGKDYQPKKWGNIFAEFKSRTYCVSGV